MYIKWLYVYIYDYICIYMAVHVYINNIVGKTHNIICIFILIYVIYVCIVNVI
jgi:hypothetical protein